MTDTRRILRLASVLLVILIFSFIFIEPVSYASLLDNARNESGSRPPTYGTDDIGTGTPTDTPGTSSGNITITKSWYRGISGMVYERTDNSSEVTGTSPRVGIKRSKSYSL